MIATGLAPLAAGEEYGCWVEVDGERRRIGEMYSGGDLWAWAGPVDGLADLPADATFGVSLVPAGRAGIPVLTGSSERRASPPGSRIPGPRLVGSPTPRDRRWPRAAAPAPELAGSTSVSGGGKPR